MSFLYYSKTYQFPRNCDTRPPYTCMSVRGQPRQRACCGCRTCFMHVRTTLRIFGVRRVHPLLIYGVLFGIRDIHKVSLYDFWRPFGVRTYMKQVPTTFGR